MADQAGKVPRLPPRWFIHVAWRVHRALYRVSAGHVGLWRPRGTKWGTLRLTVPGRRTGQERSVLLGYVEDGPTLVTLAMNGWGAGEPAWWLNLQAHPEALVEVRGHPPLRVSGRAAVGVERERLWERWRQTDADLDAFAALRPGETAVVVLEPVRQLPEGARD
jgi:deazaflavin-dependent oxidoreductase (nitroreductase family)